MNQEITESHEVDGAGNPTGGKTTAVGIEITWQNGPLRKPYSNTVFHNGAFVEGVVAAAIGRLKFFQESKFKCRENALAITKLEEALHWLDARTKERTTRGVEGTHEV